MESQKGASLTKQAIAKLAVVVKKKRKERKWSRHDLAEKSGISFCTVRNIEQGKPDNLTLYVVLCLSLALDGLDWWSIPEMK